MGIFSKKTKSPSQVSLMVMKVSSQHELQSIWDVSYSDEGVLGELASLGFAPDLSTKVDSSSFSSTKMKYEVNGRPGAYVEYYAERLQKPGFVSIGITGDSQTLDAGHDALRKVEPIIASKLPGVKTMIMVL
jgi:hypothetical protein